MTVTVLTAAGTWAPWPVGYPADVARGVTSEWDWVQAEIMGEAGPRFRWQPIGYPAVGFLNPDPNTSYNESVAAGVAEGLRLIPPGPFVLCGYSQGAEVVIRIADGLPASRRPDLRAIITFGSPSRAPGPTLVGNNPPGDGISGFHTPAWARHLTWDYVANGDMYASSTDLLKRFYRILTKAEMSVPFAVAVLQLLGSAVTGPIGDAVIGGLLTGLLGAPGASVAAVLKMVAPKASPEDAITLENMLANPADVAATIKVVAQFVSTNPHGNYHLWPDFGGTNAVAHAIGVLQRLKE